MKKYFYVVLVCLASVALFTACDQNKTDKKTYAGDQWLTSPKQFDASLVDQSTNSCWEWHVWCDGTTIGVEYFWGTEAQLLWMIDMAMAADYKVFGEYHKKFKYYLVEENTETACTSRVWEGAECWLETITYKNENGDLVSEQEYCWWPEANMKERHDYYMEKLESIGVFNHEYERANINDKDACIEMNPSDTTIVDQEEERCWKVTINYAGTTNVLYMWATESSLKIELKAYEYVGGATYEPADANDELSCYALAGEENE